MTDVVISSGCLVTDSDYIRRKSRLRPMCMRCGVNGCKGIVEVEGPVERDQKGRVVGPVEYSNLTTCQNRPNHQTR